MGSNQLGSVDNIENSTTESIQTDGFSFPPSFLAPTTSPSPYLKNGD